MKNEGANYMQYKIELQEQPAQPVLSVRARAAVGDLPQVLGNAYGAIMLYLGELGIHPSGAPFVAYYNMDMQNLDIEIGFPVSDILPEKNDIKTGEIPAGKQVSCIHKGPYSHRPGVKTSIFYVVKGDVGSGVLNGLAYHLVAPYLPGETSGVQGDGAHAAVCVGYFLTTLQDAIFKRFAVQYFCLHRVNLVEGRSGDAKLKPVQLIYYVIPSGQG